MTGVENNKQYENEILKTINRKINLKDKYYQSLKWSEEIFLWRNKIEKNKN